MLHQLYEPLSCMASALLISPNYCSIAEPQAVAAVANAAAGWAAIKHHRLQARNYVMWNYYAMYFALLSRYVVVSMVPSKFSNTHPSISKTLLSLLFVPTFQLYKLITRTNGGFVR